MKGHVIALLAALALAPVVHARDFAKVNYVGGGRYTCSGESSTCARVKQGNEAVEANRSYQGEAEHARVERSQNQAAQRQDEFRRSLMRNPPY